MACNRGAGAKWLQMLSEPSSSPSSLPPLNLSSAVAFAVAAVAAHAAVALLKPKKISKKIRGKKVLISFFNRILKVTGNCPTSTQAPFYHVSKWADPKTSLQEFLTKKI